MDVTRAILPDFRQHHAGVILNISSDAGVLTLPMISLYCASKFAAVGFDDALRAGTRQIDAADRIFANLACRSARMKGDVLDPQEQRALLDALDAIPWAPTCPHGRPVAVPFELAEIERRFGRR